MLSQRMKRVISIVLIVCMTFASNGFSVLAGSVDNMVLENQVTSNEQRSNNFYYEYREYSEQKVVLTGNADGKENEGEKNEPGIAQGDNLKGDVPSITKDESDNDSDNLDGKKSDEEKSSEADDEENKKSSEEEPEEEETTTTIKEEEESTTETSTEESEFTKETTTKESESTTETSSEESESTTKSKVEESESTTETKIDETTKESTTETTVETTVEESTTKVVVPAENETTTTAKEEIETTKNNIEENETETTEKSQETETTTSNNDIEDVKNETKIEFKESTASDAEDEVKVIKKYVYATRSIPEDSVWTLKEILTDDTTGSLKKLPQSNELKEKYLAKEVKVLVENQYGDQKVVTVPAKWDVNVLSKVYRPEGFVPNKNNYKANADGKIVEIDAEGNEKEIKLGKETEESETTETGDNKDENAKAEMVEGDIDVNTTEKTDDVKADDTEKVEEKEEQKIFEPTEKNEELKEEITEPTVAGFTGTDGEEGENKAGDDDKEENKENETPSTEDGNKTTTNDGENDGDGDEESDLSIGQEVVVEYETVDGDKPIVPNDDELEKKKVVLGNANNGVVNSKTAKEEAVAELNLAELTYELFELLGGEISIPNGTGIDVLFGAGDPHSHWACGRANCSDTARVHFNENMNTIHPVTGAKSYQAVNSYDEFKAAINSGSAQYDYIYLAADIVIPEMVKLTRPLYLCLNDHSLQFEPKGQLCTYYDYKDPNPAYFGALPYGICICGCADDNGTADGYCGTIEGVTDGITDLRDGPAIFYTKNDGVYIYGKGRNDGAQVSADYAETGTAGNQETRIKIQNFNWNRGTKNSYQVRPAQKEAADSTEVYSYPNNFLYNGNTPDTSYGGNPDPMYEDYTSSFLTMSINDKGQADTQTVRKAFFYALDIENISSNDGGFANLYYVNSFAMEHCKIQNVSAFRGGIVAADYDNRRFMTTTGTSLHNDYIDIGHNFIQNCKLSGDFTGSDANSKWGDKGRYKNGANARIIDSGTTLMDPDVVYSPDKNGLFLLENYNGGDTDENYRIIKGNKFYNNTAAPAVGGNDAVQQYMIYLTLDSVGVNTTNISYNEFGNDSGVTNNFGVLYVENLYNEKRGLPSTNSSQGTMYFDANKVYNNFMSAKEIGTEDRPKTLGVINFQSLGTVLINTKVTTTGQQYIENNAGIGTGALRVSNVSTFYIYRTKFKNNSAAYGVADAIEGKGSAIYISTCSNVKIGSEAVDDANGDMIFEENGKQSSSDVRTIEGGAIYAKDVISLNISDATFEENEATERGGAIYIKGEGNKTAVNIYGSTFNRNVAANSNAEGGAIYYSGDDAHAYEHRFYTSYYLVPGSKNIINNNKSNGKAGAIYLKNITGDSNIKYTKITLEDGSRYDDRRQVNELAIYDSTAKVNVTNVEFISNDNSSSVNKLDYSTIYVNNAELELDYATRIHENINPIRLAGATLSMASYDYRPHGGLTGIPEDEDILIYKNQSYVTNEFSNYVIGVDNDKSSTLILKQGMIYNNNLDGVANRQGTDLITTGNLGRDGILGYIGMVDDEALMKQSTVYIGGNLHVEDNGRNSNITSGYQVPSNMPLEIVPEGGDYSSVAYRHFNFLMNSLATSSFVEEYTATKTDELLTLKDGVEDVRLGRNALVTFTPINSRKHTYSREAGTGTLVRAEDTYMFKVANDSANYVRFDNRHVQGYDGGTGGAVASSVFKVDTETYPANHMIPCVDGSTVYEYRVIYADKGAATEPDRIVLIDKDGLISFSFNMVFTTDTEPGVGDHVAKIPDQMVREGSTVIQPIKDYSLAEDSSATIYTDSGKYKLIDIIGNSEGVPGSAPERRFHSWDWGAPVYAGSGSSWAPKLTAIYSVIDHLHKECGVDNGVECDHLGDNRTDFHKEYGGDCSKSSGNLDMTCIDVHIPEQLMYAREHPEYMYVLGQDIEIDDTIGGVDITGVLNDIASPTNALKICLNGHKISVKTKQTLFALCGDCYITDCQSTHGTIEYDPSVTGDGFGNIFEFVDKADGHGGYIANSLSIFGKNGASANPYITFENLRITAYDDNQAFIKGLNSANTTNAIHLEDVKFANSNIEHSLFKVTGDASFDNVVIDNIKLSHPLGVNDSIVDLKEPNSGTAEFNIRAGKISNNKIDVTSTVGQNMNGSIIKIDSRNASSIYMQDDINTGERFTVKDNQVGKNAAISIGADVVSNTTFTLKSVDFDHNYVQDGITGDVHGAAIQIRNLYGKTAETGINQITDCTFTNNGTMIYDGTNYANYNKAVNGTPKVYGGAVYMEGTNLTGTITDYTDLVFSETNFEKNFAYQGGGIYLKNSRGVMITGDTLVTKIEGNFANEGSVIYVDDTTENIVGRGSVTFQAQQFNFNGINYGNAGAVVTTGMQESKSMIYFAAVGRGAAVDAVQFNLESPIMRYNYAKEGLIKVGNSNSSTSYDSVNMYGEDASAYIEHNGLLKPVADNQEFTKYYGGPIISFANEQGYNPSVGLYKHTENVQLYMRYNYVGDGSSSTIVNDLRNLTASASMTFTGKFVIKDNFIMDGTTLKQANIKVKPTFTFSADDDLDPSFVYVYFNTDDTTKEMPIIAWDFNEACRANPVIEHLYNDNRAPVVNIPFSVNGSQIKALANADAGTDPSVVYKGENSKLYIGNLAKFANPIYAVGDARLLLPSTDPNHKDWDSDEGKASLALYGRRGAEIQLDQYSATDIPTKVFNGFEVYLTDPSGHGWSPKMGGSDYVGRTSSGEYKTWGFIAKDAMASMTAYYTNTFKVSKTSANEHLDYTWYTGHGTTHSQDKSARGNFDIDWIVAYDQSFLRTTYPDGSKTSEANEPGLTSVDIVLVNDVQLTEAISGRCGMNICLNGHAIFAPQDDSVVRLQSDRIDLADQGTVKSVALLNCVDNATTGIHGYRSDGALDQPGVIQKAMFDIQGDSYLSPSNEATLYVEGVRIGWFNYIGNTDGVIVKASFSNIYLRGHIHPSGNIDTSITSDNGSVVSFNDHTPIMIEDSNVELKHIKIKDLGTSTNPINIGKNGFIYLYGSEGSGESTSQEYRNRLSKTENTDTNSIKYITLDSIYFSSDKAFFNFEDTMGDKRNGTINVDTSFKIEGAGVHNLKDKAKGGIFYFSFPNDEGAISRKFNLSGTSWNNTGKNETKGSGALIYVEDFKSNVNTGYFDVNIYDVIEKFESQYDGGAIYFNSDGVYNSRVNLIFNYNSGSLFNVKDVSAGRNGGLVYIAQDSWNSTYPTKNRITFKTFTANNNPKAVLFENVRANEKGGIFYITDTYFDIHREGPGGIEYEMVVGSNANNVYAKEGALMWQKRSITHFTDISIVNADSETGVIYVDGSEIPVLGETRSNEQMHDSITFGGGSDTTRFSMDNSQNTATAEKGYIVIGTYSDMYFAGTIKMTTGTNTHWSYQEHEVLYIRGKGLDNEALSNLGVERKVLSGFSYIPGTSGVSSKIYASVERVDRMLISGWDLNNHPQFNQIIFPAWQYYEGDTEKPMRVYESGSAASSNIHVGYTDAVIKFVTTKVGDSTKLYQFGADVPTAIGSAKSITTLNKTDMENQAVSTSGRSASDLLGFVTYLSDNTGANKGLGNYYDFDTQFVYAANKETYVMAVWKDSTNPDLTIYNDDYNAIGYSRSNPTAGSFVHVEFYEQLYYSDTNVAGYTLAQNLYDGWTSINGGNNTSGYTYVASGSVPEPIANSEEIIYLNGKSIYKQNNSSFYKNTAGTFVLFNGETNQSKIILDSNKKHETISKDLIVSNNIELVGNIKFEGLEFENDSDASLVKMAVDEITSEFGNFYMLKNEVTGGKNIKLTLSNENANYIVDSKFENMTGSTPIIHYPDHDGLPQTTTIVIQSTLFKNIESPNVIDVSGKTYAAGSVADPVLLLNITDSTFENNEGKYVPLGPTVATNAVIRVRNSDTTYNQEVLINKTKIKGSKFYNNVIDVYGHTLHLLKSEVTQNTNIEKAIIAQHKASDLPGLNYYLVDTSVTENSIDVATVDAGYIIYQDFADQRTDDQNSALPVSLNLIASTSITGNTAKAAVYNSDIKGTGNGSMNYSFGGLVNLSGNTNAANQPANLLVKNSEEDLAHTVSFVSNNTTPDLPVDLTALISSKSVIGVTMDGGFAATDVFKTIAYESWIDSVRGIGATYQIFISDSLDLMPVKQNSSIVLMKETEIYNHNVVRTDFEPNEDGIIIPSQYLRQDSINSIETLADEPTTPVSKVSEHKFIDWRADKYLRVTYKFDSSGTPLEGEGSPKIATIYGLWKKYVKVTVVTNNGGKGPSGNPYKDVMFRGVNVAIATYSVLHGHPLSESVKMTYKDNATGTEYTINAPNPLLATRADFTREGMSMAEDWYVKNGFNGGQGGVDWGDPWPYDDDEEHGVTNDMNLYVRWQGDPKKMYFEYYDSGSTLMATGSTAVDNVYGDVYDERYNAYVEEHYDDNIDGLFSPVRHGYKFIAWHSSPSELFSDTNIIKNGDPYVWSEDITAYAEWKPATYSIIYAVHDPNINKPDGSVDLATRVEATLVFDEGLRNPNYKLKNPFLKNGYKHTSYVYDMPLRPEDSGEITDVDAPLGSINLYNAKTEKDASDVWHETVGDKTIVYVEWEPNTFKLIFDLNDGVWGNQDTYKGSNFAATDSEAFPLSEFAYDAKTNTFAVNVLYDGDVNENTDLPEPTRKGYTFEGWWTRRDKDAKDRITNGTKFNWKEISYEPYDYTTFRKATDTRVYAKWSNNPYKIQFVAADDEELNSAIVKDSTIVDIDTIFDATVSFTIPKIKVSDDNYLYQIDGYTFLGSKIEYEDNAGVNYNTIEIPHATQSLTVSVNDVFNNLKIANIDKNAVVKVVGQWKQHTYDVIYNANPPEGKTLDVGEVHFATDSKVNYTDNYEIRMPNRTQLRLDGYRFVGWATFSNATVNEVKYKNGQTYEEENRLASGKQGVPGKENDEEEYKLYAVWQKSPYRVIYNISGDNDDVPLPADAHMDNQDFSADSDYVQKFNKMPYKIPGWTFKEWLDRTPLPNNRSTYSDAFEIPAHYSIRYGSDDDEIQEVELLAQWKQNKYTIFFDVDVPESPLPGTKNVYKGTQSEITTEYSEEVELGMSAVTIDGYDFDYWEDPYGNKYRDEENTDLGPNTIKEMAATWSDGERIKLTAHFKKARVNVELNQNYDADEELPIFVTYFDATYSDIDKKPLPKPTRAGYKFMGWTKKAATPYEVVPTDKYIKDTDIVRATPTNFDSDETLYAHWNHVPYTLTLDSGSMTGGSGLVQKGTYSTTNRATSSRTVRFERPIGEKGERQETIEDLEIPKLAGYHFTSYLYGQVGQEDEADKNTIYWKDGNDTIRAEWEANTYRVQFDIGTDDADAKGQIATISATYDELTALPSVEENGTDTTFSRKGYSFDYWENTNTEVLRNINAFSGAGKVLATYSDGAEIAHVTEVDDGLVTFKAHWKEHEYTIEFDGNPKTVAGHPEVVNVVNGTMDNQVLKYTNPNDVKLTKNKFTMDGYEFLGWASTSDATTPDFADEAVVRKLAGEGYGPDGDKENTDPFVLYAVWKAKKFKVRFNLNDKPENKWGSTTASEPVRRDGAPVGFNRKNYEYELTFDQEIGNLVGIEGTNLPMFVSQNRTGYNFIGWISTMSGLDPKTIVRSSRQASAIKNNTLFRATSNVTLYALWNNKDYKLNYNIFTRNYSSATDQPTLTVPEGRDKVYFDCVFGGDGELNGPVETPGSLPTSDGGQFAFKGWYYDQKYYLNASGGIKDVATPNETTKINNNEPSFSFEVLDYIIKQHSTDVPPWSSEADIPTDGIDINGWYAGKGRTLYINPNGGELWFGGKSDTKTTGKGKRYAATTSFIAEIEVSNGTEINEGGADALPENDNTWFKGLADNKDAVSKKGYTFNGWKTVQNEGRGAMYTGYVKGDTPYWSDADNSYLRAEWTARRYYIQYNVNMPKKPGSTTEDASTKDLLDWKHADGTVNTELPSDKIVTFDTIIAPDAPTYATFSTPRLPGYTFQGWYMYQKKGNTITKTRLDVGGIKWTFGDFEKFCDAKGNNEDFIVCEDYPADSYFPTGQTRGIRKLNIYAEWKANEYKLVFDGYKGEGTTDYKITLGGVQYNGIPASVSVTFDTKINSGTGGANKWPTAITRDGYDAKGWFAIKGNWPGNWDNTDTGWYRPVTNTTEYGYQLVRDYNGGDDDAVTMNNFNGVVTLRPVWYPKQVTVNWKGLSIATATTAPKIKNPGTGQYAGSYTNYMLFDDKFGTNRVDLPIGPNTAIGITTVWPAAGKANDGTIIGSSMDPSDMYMPGYRFVKWNIGIGANKKAVTSSTKVTPSVATLALDVVAEWKPVRHKIHLNKNDASGDPTVYGSSMATLSPNTDTAYAYFDLEIPQLATPSRTGYNFKGWYTKDGVDGGTWSGDWGISVNKGTKYNWATAKSALRGLTDAEKAEFNNPTYEHTLELYAKWEPKKYKVNFFMNDSRAGKGSTEGKFNMTNIPATATPATLFVFYDHSLYVKDYT